MNMREKMARAMHRRSDRGHYDWGDEHPNVRREFTAMADAALTAMEEPTREMWAAGGNAIVGKTKVDHDAVLTAGWTAMIRAARE